ncbi:MAG: diguanylate cyclase [Trebonia sp.]
MAVRGWALWQLPRAARALVIAVVAGYLVMLGGAIVSAPFTARDVLLAATMMALSLGSIEISMRLAWPRNSRFSRDCLSVWILPVALLLPPAYVAVMVVAPSLYLHFRVSRTPPMKLVFSIAALGLAYAAAAAGHAMLAGSGHAGWQARGFVGSGRAALAILVALAAWWAVNNALVCAVVWLTSGADPVRTFVRDVENHVIDVAAACAGVAIAALWTVHPAVAFLLVPMVLLVQHHLYSDLRQAVRRDFLTDVASSRFWREIAGRELERAWANGDELAVLLIDIDHFKSINDSHGHPVGDDVLALVASRIAQALRPRDLVGRLGGEEFAAVLSGLSVVEAVAAAERVCGQVAALRVPCAGGEVSVTVSIGVAALNAHGLSLSQLLRAADQAMYAAKARGRNRVEVARTETARVIDLTSPEVLQARSDL